MGGAALSTDPRRALIEALAEQGATEGERAAARSALARLEAAERAETAETERLLGFGRRPSQEEQDEEDYFDALEHGAA